VCCDSSVFDFDDETIPMEQRNGFTFVNADEQVVAIPLYIRILNFSRYFCEESSCLIFILIEL
jgi:hypothetical protein